MSIWKKQAEELIEELRREKEDTPEIWYARQRALADRRFKKELRAKQWFDSYENVTGEYQREQYGSE